MRTGTVPNNLWSTYTAQRALELDTLVSLHRSLKNFATQIALKSDPIESLLLATYFWLKGVLCSGRAASKAFSLKAAKELSILHFRMQSVRYCGYQRFQALSCSIKIQPCFHSQFEKPTATNKKYSKR